MSLPICYNRLPSGRCVIGCGRKCKYGYIARLLAVALTLLSSQAFAQPCCTTGRLFEPRPQDKFLLTFLIIYTRDGVKHGYGWGDQARPYECREFIRMSRTYYGAMKGHRFESMECSERPR